jgi:hypothetical protein
MIKREEGGNGKTKKIKEIQKCETGWGGGVEYEIRKGRMWT